MGNILTEVVLTAKEELDEALNKASNVIPQLISDIDKKLEETKELVDGAGAASKQEVEEVASQLEETKNEVVSLDNSKLEKNVAETTYAKKVELLDKATKTELEVERQRINSIIAIPEGGTTNDARLEDIKVGADGTKYDSPGNAVRSQIKAVEDGFSDYMEFTEQLATTGEAIKLNRNNILPDVKISDITLWKGTNCNLSIVPVSDSISNGIAFTRNDESLSARISINMPKAIFVEGKKYRIGFKQLYKTDNYKIALRENKGKVNEVLNNYILSETLTIADGIYRYVDFTLNMSNSTEGYDFVDLQILSQAVNENTLFEIFIGEFGEDMYYSKKINLKQQNVQCEQIPNIINYKKNTVFSNFDDDSFWNVYNLDKIDETSNLIAGKKTFFITCQANTNGIMTKNCNKNLRNSILSIYTYCEDVSNLTACSIMISFDDTSFSKMAYCYITPTQECVDTKTWLKHTITPLDWTFQGNSTINDLENVKSIRISLRCSSNGSATVGLDNFTICEKTLNKGGVLFLFDDGRKNIFENAMPIFDKYGYSATTYAITDYVGTTQTDSTGEIYFMTLEQLRILRDKGWVIGSHTKTHNHLTQLKSDELDTVLRESHEWLIKNGFKNGSEYLAYPFGEFNSNVTEVARRYYKCAFTTREKNFGEYSVNKMEIPRFSLVRSKYSVQQVKDLLLKAFNNKQIFVIYLHNIGDGMDWTTKEFEEIIDYVNEIDIPVLTVDDLSNMFNFNND